MSRRYLRDVITVRHPLRRQIGGRSNDARVKWMTKSAGKKLDGTVVANQTWYGNRVGHERLHMYP